MKEITKEEYYEWLKTADEVGIEYPIFTSFCGPHEFGTNIKKDGILYELSWGWGWNLDNKTEISYGIKTLHKLPGQDGEGI